MWSGETLHMSAWGGGARNTVKAGWMPGGKTPMLRSQG